MVRLQQLDDHNLGVRGMSEDFSVSRKRGGGGVGNPTALGSDPSVKGVRKNEEPVLPRQQMNGIAI